MSITLKIKGLDAAIKNANKIASTARKETQYALNDFAERTAKDAKALAPADEGGIRGAIATRRGELSASVVVAKDYAAFMEFGTRKYAEQYVSSLPADWRQFAEQFKGSTGGTFDEMLQRILEWVRRKKIDVVNRQTDQQYDAESGNVIYTKKIRVKKSVRETMEEKAAYAIAIKILREGIKPQPFVYPAVNANIDQLNKDMNNVIK